jgi:hypothetical protein
MTDCTEGDRLGNYRPAARHAERTAGAVGAEPDPVTSGRGLPAGPVLPVAVIVDR